MKKKPKPIKRKVEPPYSSVDEVISDGHLPAFLSQPRAMLIVCRELFERVGGQKYVRLCDDGINNLTFIIGDKFKLKKQRRNKS